MKIPIISPALFGAFLFLTCLVSAGGETVHESFTERDLRISLLLINLRDHYAEIDSLAAKGLKGDDLEDAKEDCSAAIRCIESEIEELIEFQVLERQLRNQLDKFKNRGLVPEHPNVLCVQRLIRGISEASLNDPLQRRLRDLDRTVLDKVDFQNVTADEAADYLHNRMRELIGPGWKIDRYRPGHHTKRQIKQMEREEADMKNAGNRKPQDKIEIPSFTYHASNVSVREVVLAICANCGLEAYFTTDGVRLFPVGELHDPVIQREDGVEYFKFTSKDKHRLPQERDPQLKATRSSNPTRAEPAGPGQPATKPADKAPVEVQPSPPTSNDAPR